MSFARSAKLLLEFAGSLRNGTEWRVMDETKTAASEESEVDSEPLKKKKMSPSRQAYLARHKKLNGYESNWLKHREGEQLTFHTISGPVTDKLLRAGKYALSIPDGEEEMELDKLDLLCLAEAEAYELIAPTFRLNQAIRKKGLLPPEDRSKRFQIPDKVLTEVESRGVPIQFTLLDGTLVVGCPVAWSFFSILVKVPKARWKKMVIFKHGVHSVQSAPGHQGGGGRGRSRR